MPSGAAELTGIELSPFRVFASIASDDTTSVTGGFTFGTRDAKTEIAVPWLLVRESEGTRDSQLFKIDLHWRRFQRKGYTGNYAGVFLRAMQVTSEARNNFKGQRAGAGIVIGRRSFLTERFYWGVNAQVGLYAGDFDKYDGDDLVDIFEFGEFSVDLADKLLFNVEFLKIGYRF